MTTLSAEFDCLIAAIRENPDDIAARMALIDLRLERGERSERWAKLARQNAPIGIQRPDTFGAWPFAFGYIDKMEYGEITSVVLSQRDVVEFGRDIGKACPLLKEVELDYKSDPSEFRGDFTAEPFWAWGEDEDVSVYFHIHPKIRKFMPADMVYDSYEEARQSAFAACLMFIQEEAKR